MSVSRTEFAKLALGIVVGRNKLIGSPRRRPAGLEKFRAEVRRSRGWVNAGAGAAGRSEAALSGAEAPAPTVCWANPDGTPAANVSMTAAIVRSRLPACLRPACTSISGTVSSCCSNTRLPYKFMIPLHELLRHVGCHSSRRPESLSGRNIVIRQGDFRAKPRLRAPFALRTPRPVRSSQFVSASVGPAFPAAGSFAPAEN